MSELINIVATVMRASSHRFVGRLGRDPEVRFLDSGKAVANGRIAINIPGSKQGDGKEPDWFKVEVWGDSAQSFADQCHKGDLVEVIGRVRTNRWTDGQGQPRVDLVVTADSWSLVRPSGQAAAPAAAASPPAHLAAAGWQPNPQQGTVAWNSAPLADPDDDDEIPF